MPTHSLDELAEMVGGEAHGDGDARVSAVTTLESAGPDDLSFYHNRKYLDAARKTGAGVLLVGDPGPFPGRNLLVCHEPYVVLAGLIELFHPVPQPPAGVHPSAVVSASATIGEGASIGPHAVVGEHACVGAGTVIGAGAVVGDGAAVGERSVLHANVVVERGCRVGARCVVHAGAVIGSDGFGFANSGGVHHKVPQVGIVVVEDDVELGANVCVDRATFGETRIGKGTKVDNLVQVGHNVEVGEHSLLVAQSGISGSTKLGRRVVMAGQSGAVGHVTVAEGTVVTAKAGVTEDTMPGQMISGWPGRPHREWLKAMGNLFRLEELRRRVKSLEDVVARLGGKA